MTHNLIAASPFAFLLATGEVDFAPDSNLLRNIIQFGCFGLISYMVYWVLTKGSPMLRDSLAAMSASHAATIAKISADNKLAMEQISADCKATVAEVIRDCKAQIDRKNAECAAERLDFHAMMERSRVAGEREREEYRKSDKDLREILQVTVNKFQMAAPQGGAAPRRPSRPQ